MKSEEIRGWEEGMGGKRKFATSFFNLKKKNFQFISIATILVWTKILKSNYLTKREIMLLNRMTKSKVMNIFIFFSFQKIYV